MNLNLVKMGPIFNRKIYKENIQRCPKNKKIDKIIRHRTREKKKTHLELRFTEIHKRSFDN